MQAIMRMGLCALATIWLSTAASAAPTNTVFTGTVSKIRSHDSSLFPGDADWFTLTGFTSSGTCKKDGTQVVVVIKEGFQATRQMAAVNAAMLSGKPLTVVTNDSSNVNGYCYGLTIEMK